MEKVVRRTLAALAIAAAAGGCGSTAGSGGGKEPDPSNELPLGFVDMPSANAVVPPQFPAAGWALDDTGIAVVRLYVDGRYVASTHLETDRPDVTKAFPQYTAEGNRHGWQAMLKVDRPGPHTLIVQAVDKAGATRDLGVVPFTVKP
jgi:hypothetical protein